MRSTASKRPNRLTRRIELASRTVMSDLLVPLGMMYSILATNGVLYLYIGNNQLTRPTYPVDITKHFRRPGEVTMRRQHEHQQLIALMVIRPMRQQISEANETRSPTGENGNRLLSTHHSRSGRVSALAGIDFWGGGRGGGEAQKRRP